MKKPLFVGLDLGGNHVKVALGDGAGPDLIFDASLPSRVAEGRAGILAALVEAGTLAIEHARSIDAELGGVALGTPGVVDQRTGSIRYEVANLPEWKGVDLRGTLEEAFELPASVDNDGNLAAYAEARFGAGRSAGSCVMATVGTGIGGGAVIGGVLLRGEHGAGMELGHVPRLDDGPLCGCGRRGCVEAFSGGRSMRRRWIERLRAGEGTAPANRELDRLALRDLIESANHGDPVAISVLEEGAEQLGIGLVSALHLLNPGVLILGGGVVDGCSWFADRVEAVVRTRALAKAVDDLRVERAEFGNRAGVVGAIALAAAERSGEPA